MTQQQGCKNPPREESRTQTAVPLPAEAGACGHTLASIPVADGIVPFCPPQTLSQAGRWAVPGWPASHVWLLLPRGGTAGWVLPAWAGGVQPACLPSF